MSRVEALLGRLEHFGLKLGLERVRAVLSAVGSPQSALPVVLVAGTNGKGSTAALIASMATAAGYRSGLFTSPHLERVEERIRVDGRCIGTETLADCLESVVAAASRGSDVPVTYFEALTAAALCHFRDRSVDLAVLEVGLGGRLDATNVTDPVLSVITGVSFDHQRQLGETLAEIAREKAGILRPGRPAVSLQRADEAREAIARAAEETGAQLAELGVTVDVGRRTERPDGGQRLCLETEAGEYRLDCGLGGAHQADNLALAVAAVERLAASGWDRLDRAAVEAGVSACRWPARLEWVRGGPLPILLDAAHNPAGVASLDAYLEAQGHRFTLLFGMLRAKVDPAVTGRLWRRAERVVLTTPPSYRALPPAELAERVGATDVEVIPLSDAALERALAVTAPDLLVVSGSIYLVGEMRSALRRRFGVPPEATSLFEGS